MAGADHRSYFGEGLVPQEQSRTPWMALLPRQLVFQIAGEFMNVRCVAEPLQFLLGRLDIDVEMAADFVLHLKQRGEFLLREHADLKIEMRAPLGLAGHAILTDQNENGQDDAFRGNDESQNSEWKWIEGLHGRDKAEIDGAPSKDEQNLEKQEGNAAGEFGDGVAGAFGGSAAEEGVVFEFGDRFDVELGGMGGFGGKSIHSGIP
jgi:hypothetical protein